MNNACFHTSLWSREKSPLGHRKSELTNTYVRDALQIFNVDYLSTTMKTGAQMDVSVLALFLFTTVQFLCSSIPVAPDKKEKVNSKESRDISVFNLQVASWFRKMVTS